MGDSSDEQDLSALSYKERRILAKKQAAATSCPYLDTIDRKVLNFDMEKVCSVTLSPQHVYMCLVCGKYFSGRGASTPAFTHSVQNGHHVFMSIPSTSFDEKVRFWCLPDNYEILDPSLEDIRQAYSPVFTDKDIEGLDTQLKPRTDSSGVTFYPGFIGLNNLGYTDSITTVVQVLAHCKPFRNFWLRPELYKHVRSPLVQRFGELVRRIWNPYSLRSTVSPQEFVNTLSIVSGRRFGQNKLTEAADLMVWLLNALHEALTNEGEPISGTGSGAIAQEGDGSGRKRGRSIPPLAKESIVTQCFRGEVEVTLLSSDLEVAKAQRKAKQAAQRREKIRREMDPDLSSSGAEDKTSPNMQVDVKPDIMTPEVKFPLVERKPFLFLTMDLPEIPLFRESTHENILIPSHPIYKILSKFDGETITETLIGQYRERRKYKIITPPNCLLLVFKRFQKLANNVIEKNPTIVTFPLESLDISGYTTYRPDLPALPVVESEIRPDEVNGMSVSALRAFLSRTGKLPVGPAAFGLEKSDLVRLVKEVMGQLQGQLEQRKATGYGLLYALSAATVHDSTSGGGSGGTGSLGAGKEAKTTRPVSLASSVTVGGATVSSDTGATGSSDLPVLATNPLLNGSYKTYLPRPSKENSGGRDWVVVEDLFVDPALPQIVTISEAYVLAYERQLLK